jgi:hypothetical protein
MPYSDLEIVTGLQVSSDNEIGLSLLGDPTDWDCVLVSSLNAFVYGEFEIVSDLRNEIYSDLEIIVSMPVHSDLEVVTDLINNPFSDLVLRQNLSDEVYSDLEISTNISDFNFISSDCKIVLSLLDESALVFTPTCIVTLNGENIEVLSFSISLDEDSYCYDLEASLNDTADYYKCVPLSEIIFTINGVDFHFVIDSRMRSRQFGSTVFTIYGRSPSSALGEGRALAINKTWPRTSVEAVFSELCTAAGVSYTFNINDWILPDNLLVAEGEFPISVLKRLALATGALIQPNPAGELEIFYKYEVSPLLFDTLSGIETVSDESDIISIMENKEIKPKWDVVTISNLNVTDSPYCSIEEIEGSFGTNVKKLRVWISPVPASVTLSTSFNPSYIFISEDGDNPKDVEFTEVVSIINGVGSVNRPIDSILSTHYFHADLGEVNFSGTSILTETKGESLLEITYNSKYFDFLVGITEDADYNQVQIYIEEED